jgi:hypothetical protein
MSVPAASHARRTSAIVAALVLAFLVIVAGTALSPAALAGGPGTWTDVSGPVGSLLVQPRLARDAAGLLHVVWITEGPT